VQATKTYKRPPIVL